MQKIHISRKLILFFNFKVFGLHSNADITYQTKTTSDVLETIVNIQPKDSSGGSGETRESLVARQASEMLDKLPVDYVPFEVRIPRSFMIIAVNDSSSGLRR